MKKIGIGYEKYKDFIDENIYYVDKTMFIRDLIEKGGLVTLFTRPRRFGKTLALSMLQTFFEDERDSQGDKVNNERYFHNMKIMEAGPEIISRMGQYPVIRMSFKSAKQDDFDTAFLKIREEIISEFKRHSYLKKYMNRGSVEIAEFESFEQGMYLWDEKEKTFCSREDREQAIKSEYVKYSTAIKTLSTFLRDYHHKNVVILLDEYDVPLENAYNQGFYDEMVGLIRSLFESALKTNDALALAVVTGCLRISKESIFTGLNNLEVNTINGVNFGEFFGFTTRETEIMLSDYNLTDDIDTVKEWYDGYLFGDCEVYNPWSVIKYVNDHISNPSRFPEPYWSNTSSNSIIREMVENADEAVKNELDILISGGTLEKVIHEDITYGDIRENDDNLWNFLYFTGYMKKVSARIQDETIYFTMKIPNREIAYVFKNQIRQWFEKSIKQLDYNSLYNAVKNQDVSSIEGFVRGLLAKSISYYDSDEGFYHGLLLSLLYGMPNYTVKSNREEGDGRPDIVIYPNNPEDPAYIFEIKNRKKFSEISSGLQEALSQIIDKRYEEGILDDGYLGVVSYAICFCKKTCVVGTVK
ncbi:PD-(D/E)XK nuclease superfamily protein [Pseudobutyrivibrio sp. ACV-2]|uniref:AAA family ATPase n=1 Tax=Pseudobutyrivibrio sp. ACV-2 TaxID=1520801 RepID=UPI000897BB92|nr:AAA family ATPase [Pseudobutyrivibrio sp. ACV-2]SEA02315.1 PD-(D/E)XK nuclease superfamily protein [Pseudobutyrivibrio sp. ACV-2]